MNRTTITMRRLLAARGCEFDRSFVLQVASGEVLDDLGYVVSPGVVRTLEGDELQSFLDREFFLGHGNTGKPLPRFRAWDSQQVYFPCVYDGSFWVGSVSRSPRQDGIELIHDEEKRLDKRLDFDTFGGGA